MTYCKDIMTANPACCVPNDDVQHVSQMMRDENVGAIPVVEDHQSKKLLGIITDRDITVNVVAQGNNGDTKVRDVMTSELVTCHAQDDVHQATEAMAEHQIRRIPVVDNNQTLIGIIAQADVATRLEEAHETAKVVEEISKPS